MKSKPLKIPKAADAHAKVCRPETEHPGLQITQAASANQNVTVLFGAR